MVQDRSKQVYGRVVVDMRNGKVWGFPTYTPDTYPSNQVDTKPQISHPFYLGRFAFEDADRKDSLKIGTTLGRRIPPIKP